MLEGPKMGQSWREVRARRVEFTGHAGKEMRSFSECAERLLKVFKLWHVITSFTLKKMI